jgi:hypothetical protein
MKISDSEVQPEEEGVKEELALWLITGFTLSTVRFATLGEARRKQ